MVIGITGGIGSGKSTVCKLIECMGYKVYYCDYRASELINTNYEIIQQIKNEFSDGIYKDGILDRKKLASEVFSNNSKLRTLERIVHPHVIADLEDFLAAHYQEIVFVESAIMFESKLNKFTNFVITISSPIALRISRVISRDNASYDAVSSRISAQMSDFDREKLSDYTIVCDDHNCVTTQLLDILKRVSI